MPYVIKRYSNRKLYDTKDSRYVTLLQIAEMVRGGEEVQIIDNNTKDHAGQGQGDYREPLRPGGQGRDAGGEDQRC